MSDAPTLDALTALSADEIARRLSGPPDEVAAFVRAAAVAGVAEAQARFGQMLLDGTGVKQDQRAALGWFARAAKAGHVEAINMIGRCYDLGWGTAVDKARAAEWYRAAADRGLDWGMYNLGTLLALGEGVARDHEAALALFRRAGAMGNAKALNFIGSFYEDGWAVEADIATAAGYYARAAEGGDFRGRFNHSRMLADAGRIDEALAWLARVPETATPRFIAQVRAYLAASDIAAFRKIAPDWPNPAHS